MVLPLALLFLLKLTTQLINMSNRSSGKFAQAISDRSGQAFPYREMVREWNGAWVHTSEYEPKQPQLNPKPHRADPQSLGHARPNRVEPPVLILLPSNPFQTIIYSGTTYINVHSPNNDRSTGNIVRFYGATSPTGYLTIPTFDGVSDISNSSGFTISLGQINSSGVVTGGTTTDALTNPINYFYFQSADNATTGGIYGGGNACSVGPVTLQG